MAQSCDQGHFFASISTFEDVFYYIIIIILGDQMGSGSHENN
eukprot:UN15944